MAQDEDWNGRIANLNIPQEGQPELFDELSGLSNRGRGHRIRMLATLGLVFLRGGGRVQVQAPVAGCTQELPSEEVDIESSKQVLTEKLLRSATPN